MARILTVTPNPLLDFQATGSVVPGGVTRVTAFTPVAGGKGVNMARILARHGHQVTAAGLVGSGHGDGFANLVEDSGVEAAFTRVAAPARVGFQVVDAARARTTAVLGSGFPVSPTELAALLRRLRPLAAAADLVLVGGSVPDPSCLGLIRQICELCARVRVDCWVDAYGPAMDEALAGAQPPALAKPNRQEYGEGRRWLACRELHLTDGAKAVKVRSPEGVFLVTPPRIAELNPIGSGDCYLAALAHARLSGWPLPDQLAYAAAAGAANARRMDVAGIGPAEIASLARRTVVEQRGRPGRAPPR